MTWEKQWRLSAALAVATGFTGSVFAQVPVITPEQRIEAATRALGDFERTRTPHAFDTVLQTVSSIGDPISFLDRDGRVREQQIKDAFGVFFLTFRGLDGMKLPNYAPSALENRCYLAVAPRGGLPETDPKDVEEAEARRDYQAELDANRKRCERNAFQLAWVDLDAQAQVALHKFVLKVSSGEDPKMVIGSHFAYALGKSGLVGERSSQMRAIFDDSSPNWQPAGRPREEEKVSVAGLVLDDNVTPETAKAHTAEWLRSGNAREAAWAAHYAVRDRWTDAIPLLLGFLHEHEFDPLFERYKGYYGIGMFGVDTSTGRDLLDGMEAVLDALIELRAKVLSEDLFQIARAMPDQVTLLAALPDAQENVLLYIYLSGGMTLMRNSDYHPRSGATPSAGADKMRWIAAGNILARSSSRAFAQRLFAGFALDLRLTVTGVEPHFLHSFSCGSDGDPSHVRGLDWPPVGTYRWLLPNVPERGVGIITQARKPPAPDDPKPEEIGPVGEPFAPGGVGIRIVRKEERNYHFAEYDVPCPQIFLTAMPTHWLEDLGIGTYGEGIDGPPNYVDTEPGPSEGADWFHLREGIRVSSDDAYHAELKKWLADQRVVFQKIVGGLRSKGLITEAQAHDPLRIHVYGADYRFPSVSYIARAPWEDVAPSNTEISWVVPK